MSLLCQFRRQKKTRKDLPGGFVDNVRTLLLVGTIAIRTHAPLARHMFYVFFHVDWLDVLAHYVGDIKAHYSSRANQPEKVKFYSSQGGGIVVAPSEADDTSSRYFAKAPVLTGDGGRRQPARRSASC